MSKQIFIILLPFIFIAELAVMELFSPLLLHQPPLAAGLLDASILALLLVVPLWLLSWRLPTEGHQGTARRLHRGQLYLFFQLLTAAFAAEFLVMFYLPEALPNLTWGMLSLLDATLTILLVLPVLWWTLQRVGDRFDKLLLAEFLGTPIMLYSTLLYAVFISDIIQEILQPYITPSSLDDYYILIDSTLTTILIAPFLWMLVGRPLTSVAQTEKTRAKTILDQVVDAVVTLDADGRIILMNPAAQKVFDCRPDELTGQPIEVLFLENQLDIQQLISDTSGGKAGRQELMFREILCRSCSGTILTMNISLSSIQQHGRKEWLLILHDITHHKAAEKALRERDERFRQIFEQSDDAIAFFKPNSCWIIDVNTTFAELFGYSKGEIREHGLERLLGPEDFSRICGAIQVTSQNAPVTINDFNGFRNDGSQFNLSMRSKLMTIDGVGVVSCSFRDISNRLRLEKEAKDIQAKLIQTNKMTSLGLMVSGVAHEINNPNNFIITNSRLLASTWEDNRKILLDYYQQNGDFCLGGIPFSELDKHAPELFAGILEGSNRINEIVSNLKSFYRADRIAESSVNLNQIAASAASLLHHELVNFTNNFHLLLADELPTVIGNGQQIGQVVINLLMNACQALTDKVQGIWLETGYDQEASQVTLMVRDEGRGMSQGDSRRILEPFFTTKLDEGGTGLGLSICKSIIVEHDGTLEFNSKPGKGTTFVVRLPADTSAAKD